ncbi:MAG: DUF192 domain-containing protein [Betaproteobacteria bacterium]|nr:DUF192 domain-containing protein [Betaproteobacteria bacterium]
MIETHSRARPFLQSRARRAALAVTAGLLLAPAAPRAAETLELAAGIHRIEAEVANTFEGRATGLMHRSAMAAGRGMLFVFPDVAVHCMWMRNTLIPLSVAFLDEGGRIINIEDMQAQTETNHCARRPARYALEMNLGWFRQRGVKAGAAIAGMDRAPPPR